MRPLWDSGDNGSRCAPLWGQNSKREKKKYFILIQKSQSLGNRNLVVKSRIKIWPYLSSAAWWAAKASSRVWGRAKATAKTLQITTNFIYNRIKGKYFLGKKISCHIFWLIIEKLIFELEWVVAYFSPFEKTTFVFLAKPRAYLEVTLVVYRPVMSR